MECRACFAIRARHPHRRDEASLQSDYAEEYAYIGSRRRQIDTGGAPAGPPIGPQRAPAHLTGLALSGGGIRSASFDLGALQALEAADAIDAFDYMSAVSGGGYLAGWVQNHYGARQQLYRDVFGYEVGTDDAASLLDNAGDQVEQLRTHTRFIQGSSWFEGPKVFFQWLVRWPTHLIIDDVLHLRGGYNWTHIIDIYQDRIEETYFRGTPPAASTVPPKAEMPLIEVNDAQRASLTPYLVLNANLLNSGASQVSTGSAASDQWSFEFTRDFVGSDGTGYIEARGFDHDVEYVVRDAGRPVAAVVDLDDRVPDLDDADASPMRLSTAVATSGAAFDSLAGVSTLVDFPLVTEAAQFIGGGVLNLYLGYDAPNFSSQYDGNWSPLGYVNMVTWERVPRWVGTGANWLYITDGGHYENLGALALLRRGVQCVVQFDAAADPDAKHEDLYRLSRRVESDLGMSWLTTLPDRGDARGRYRFEIGERGGQQPTAVILYVKANANTDLPHLRPDYATSPLARRDELEREVHRVEALETDAIAALTGEAGTPPGLVARGAAASGAAHAYYEAVISNQDEADDRRRAAQARADGAERKVSDAEASLANLQSLQESLCRDADEIGRADVSPAGLPADATAAERETLLEELAALNATRSRRCAAIPGNGPPADLKAIGPMTAIADRVRALAGGLAQSQLDVERQITIIDGFRAEREQARNEVVLAGAPSRELRDADDAREEAYERLEAVAADAAAVDVFRARVRRNATRLERALRADRNWAKHVAERQERIRKIRDYSVSGEASDFPHTDTILEWYDWERFEAYRLLGFQMASTYLERLKPGDGLEWCDFAPAPPGESDAPAP
ncbi:MAG: hypothetical protein U0802_04700 [Candidatus Binatia bacterium]